MWTSVTLVAGVKARAQLGHRLRRSTSTKAPASVAWRRENEHSLQAETQTLVGLMCRLRLK